MFKNCKEKCNRDRNFKDWDIPSSVVVGSLAMDGPSTISAAGDFTGSGGDNASTGVLIVLTIVLQSGTNVCASGLKHVTTAVAVPSLIIDLKQYLFVVRSQLAIRGVFVDGIWRDDSSSVKEAFFDHYAARFKKPLTHGLKFDLLFPKRLAQDQDEI
nr:RNA-directed DNA polymerase, eukaryota [Tanacetum cinerariifolium]